jgi:hypothetical protein
MTAELKLMFVSSILRKVELGNESIGSTLGRMFCRRISGTKCVGNQERQLNVC